MKIITILIIKLFTILTLTFFSGCATPPTPGIETPIYQEKSNVFSPDETHYYGDSITLKQAEKGKQDFSFIRLNFTKTNQARIWHFNTFYHSKVLILDPSIIFDLDGKVYSFTPEALTNRGYGRLKKGYIEETSQFIVPETLIANLRKSKLVTVKFTGQNYYKEKVLDSTEMGHMIFFINHINSLIIE